MYLANLFRPTTLHNRHSGKVLGALRDAEGNKAPSLTSKRLQAVGGQESNRCGCYTVAVNTVWVAQPEGEPRGLRVRDT